MSKVFIEESTLTAIGDAIREKTEKTDKIPPLDMPQEIRDIQTAGLVEEITITSNGTYTAPDGIDGYTPVIVNVPQDGAPPDDLFEFTDTMNYCFANDNWIGFLEEFGERITTKNVRGIYYMVYQSNIEYIPFEINLQNYRYGIQLNNGFANARKLKNAPIINGVGVLTPPSSATYALSVSNLFQNCNALSEIPDDYFWRIADKTYWDAEASMGGGRNAIFYGCQALRKLPDLSMLVNNAQISSILYKQLAYQCYILDEIIDLPVIISAKATTSASNTFDGSFSSCLRLKNLTFKTQDDGTPFIVEWRNELIDLSTCGYGGSIYNHTGSAGGLTTKTQVKDDATYQELKNNPDWFSLDVNYSRYDKQSALNTINSLPDTSAYLATLSNITNTIKFKGEAGSKTDGGAINTLTAEEIAVATAKGWTVTFA